MKIGLLSDTHGYLDKEILDFFAECDEIWHAGDIGSEQILDDLEKFKPTKAVRLSKNPIPPILLTC